MSPKATNYNYAINSVKKLATDGNAMILLTISFGWFVSLGIRIVYPTLLPDIITVFRVDYTSAGFLLSSIWITYAVVQFPGGILGDRFGEQTILLTSVFITIISIIITITAPSFTVFVLATLLIGLGTGLYGTNRVTVLTDIYSKNQTVAVSFSQISGNIGNAILPVIAGFITAFFSWRFGFGYLIPLFVLVFVGIFVFLPKRTSDPPETDINLAYGRNLKLALTNRYIIYSTLLLFLIMFYYQGITGFLPSYLIEVKGLPHTVASTVYGGFFVIAVITQLISGIISDQFGEQKAIILSLLIGLPAVTILPLVQADWAVIPIALLCATIFGSIPPSHSYIVVKLPESLQGSGYGLIRTIYIGLAATSPIIAGYIADIGYFNYIFAIFILVIVLALMISSYLQIID